MCLRVYLACCEWRASGELGPPSGDYIWQQRGSLNGDSMASVGATAEDWHLRRRSVSLVGNSDPLLHSAGTAALHAADQQNKSRATAAKPKIGLCIYMWVFMVAGMYGDTARPWIHLLIMEKGLFVFKMICMKVSKSVKMSIHSSFLVIRHIVLQMCQSQKSRVSSHTHTYCLVGFNCVIRLWASPPQAQMTYIHSLILKNKAFIVLVQGPSSALLKRYLI